MIMYGPESEANKMRYKDMALEEYKEIPMTPSTADVIASSDEHYSREKKEQLLMDTEGVIDGAHQKWITERSHDAWFKIDFKDKVYTICGFGLKSADDCPSRDPTHVKVSYFDATEDKMIQIAEFELDF